MAHEFSEDILRGAGPIAAYIYGDEKERRKVYHLVETGQLPHFRLGSVVCGRKSTIKNWIEEQEKNALRQREVA